MNTAQEIAQLRAENTALRLVKLGTVKRKRNGHVSVYGVRDTPITLTPAQWRTLLAQGPSLNVLLDTWNPEVIDLEEADIVDHR